MRHVHMLDFEFPSSGEFSLFLNFSLFKRDIRIYSNLFELIFTADRQNDSNFESIKSASCPQRLVGASEESFG